jgi:hypothetical protein
MRKIILSLALCLMPLVAAASEQSLQDLTQVTALTRYKPLRARTVSMGDGALTVEAEGQEDPRAALKAIFFEKIDEDFFKRQSRLERIAVATSALLGLAPQHPLCGVLIYNVGDMLRLAKDSAGVDSLIAWVTVSTTPAFMHQMANRGQIIYKAIAQPRPYTLNLDELGEDDRLSLNEVIPGASLLFETNATHKILKLSSFASSVINASVPLLPLVYIEEEYPLFLVVTSPAFFLALLEHGYTVAEERLRDIFSSRIYPISNIRMCQRDILLERLAEFQERIARDDEFAADMYSSLVRNETGIERTFKFSALFMKSISRIQKPKGDTDRLWNASADFEELPRPSLASGAIAAMTHGLIHLAQYPRFKVTQYFPSTLLIWAGMDANAAWWTSHSLAGFVTLHRYLSEYGVHTATASRLSLPTDNRGLRRGVRLVSAVNALLLTLIYCSLGLQALADETPASKTLWLGSMLALDFWYFYDFFDRHNNGAITETVTLPPMNSRLALLNRYAERAKVFVQDAHDGAVKVLYREVFGGI